jgi:N6-L-threonylcarbamoyladenine synthase
MKAKICLGIESTAHTFGVGIVTDSGKILANVKDVFTTEKGGMIPNEVAEHHKKIADKVIEDALKAANLKLEDINLISFSKGPGLAPSLLVGMKKAKELAKKLNIPLVGVNHCVAHLEIGNLVTGAKDPVLLYASGVNTQVIAFEGGKYRIFGETLDIGVGNFLDSFARELEIGFPGGPKIEQLAKQSTDYIELPYAVKGMDVSFGGMLTNLKQKIKSGKHSKEDLAFSCQETAFAMLIEVSERAMAHCGKKELLLGGGVCCNKRLREMAETMCRERNAQCFIPENQFLVDNAAMIAWQGIIEHKAGRTENLETVDIMPHWRTDQVDAVWRKQGSPIVN